MQGLNRLFRKKCARLMAGVLMTIMILNCLPAFNPAADIVYAAELSGTYNLGGKDYSGTLGEAFAKLSATEENVLVLKSDFLVDSRLVLPHDHKLILNLDGHEIKGGSSSGFITVSENASLKIEGKGGKIYGFADSNGLGGAFFAAANSKIELEKLTINGNTAKNGGAVYLETKADLRLSAVNFSGNTASNNGGAIYINGSNVTTQMDNAVKFEMNASANAGGGIYVNGNGVDISGSGALMTGNMTFAGNGAAICVSGDVEAGKSCNVTIRDLRIDGNTSNGSGGGICLRAGGCTLNNVTVTGNSAAKSGGGISDLGSGVKSDPNTKYQNITVTGNKLTGSGTQGKGIYAAPDRVLYISGKTVISDNVFLDDSDDAHAYLSVSGITSDSEITLLRKEDSFSKITNEPCDAKLRIFTYDKSDYHLEIDEDEVSATYKYLVLKKGAPSAASNATALDITKWKTGTANAGFTYKATDGAEYPVVYGYASTADYNGVRDIVNKYFYSDGYFMSDPSVYDAHLSTMSMNMAMAGADSNLLGHSDYRYKFDNVKSILKGIGCANEDIYLNDWYIQKPTDDSIGVAIGKKQIKSLAEDNGEYILVPIIIRGCNYESEWASNVTLNGANTAGEDNPESSGFKSARTQTIESLEYFMDHYNVRPLLREGKVKFWVTGFSRGSATANLVGKYLVDNYGVYSSTYHDKPNQVFAYCMASPAGGTDSAQSPLAADDNGSGYYCIHNVINKADLTPMVAPELMGFKRYGVDHYVPGSEKAEITSEVTNASAENGGYSITRYKDNNYWKTKTSEYNMWRPNMLEQLASVNTGVKFNDNFRVSEFALTSPNLRPSEKAEFANVSIEDWLVDLYTNLQKWEVLDEGKTLTRANYSGYVMHEGTTQGSWYNNGTDVQTALRVLTMMLMSRTPEENQRLLNAIKSVYNKLGSSGNFFSSKPSVLTIYTKLISSYGWKEASDQQYWLDQFWSMLIDNSNGQPSILDPGVMTQAEFQSFKQSFPVLMGLCFRVIPTDYQTNEFHLVATLLNNASIITQAHVPEVYLAWLRSYDSYYDGEKDKAYKFTGGSAAPTVPSPENLSDGGTFSGTQTLKLTGDADSEIYYRITKESGSESTQSPLKLYRRGEGIDLLPSKDGNVIYSVETYALRNHVGAEDKIEVLSSESKVYTFNISSGNNLYVKNTPGMSGYNTISYAGGTKVTLDAKIPEGQGSNYKFKEWKLEVKNGDSWNEWAEISDQARKKAVCSFAMPDCELRAEAIFIPVVAITGLNDIGINLQTFSLVAGSKLPSKTEQAPAFLNGLQTIQYSGTAKLSWEFDNSVVTDRIKSGMQYRFSYELSDWTSDDGNTAYRFDKSGGNWTTAEDSGYTIEITNSGIKVVSNWIQATGEEETEEKNSYSLKINYHSLSDNIGITANSYTVEKDTEFTLDAESLLYDGLEAAGHEEDAYSYWVVYMTQTGISGDAIDGWAEGEKLFDDYIWFDMPDNDVVIDIYFGKAIEEIHLQTEFAPEPEAGAFLEAGISSCTITIGNKDYNLDPEDVIEKWTPDADIAMANTAYTVTYTIDTSKLEDESGNNISGSYIIFDDSVAYINESEDDEAKRYSCHIMAGETGSEADEKGLYHKVSFSITFGDTGSAAISSISNPEEVTITWDSSVSDRSYQSLIIPLLPGTVHAVSGDGGIDSLSVTWDDFNADYDSTSASAQNLTVTGTAIIPEGYTLAENIDNKVTARVFVEGAPYISMAVPYPDSQVVECDKTSGEGSVNVEIFCETEGATIYYTLDGSDPVDEKGHLTSSASSYEAGSEITIRGNSLSDSQNIVSLKTTAIKEGMQTGEVYTASYEFIKPMAEMDPDELELIYELELVEGQKLDSIGEGYLPNGWFWDESINNPATFPEDGTVKIGDYVDAVITYNPDSSLYSDTKLIISIPVVDMQYYIESEGIFSMAYRLLDSKDVPEGKEDEYDKYDENHYLSRRIFAAAAGTEVVLLYDKKDDNGNAIRYLKVVTASGKVVSLSVQNASYTEELYSCIFTMPAEEVRITAVSASPEETETSAVLLNGNVTVNELTLISGMKTVLYPSVYPFNSLDAITSVSWQVDKTGKKAITLKKGLITAKKAGEATVTAVVKIQKPGEKLAKVEELTCRVHVIDASEKPKNKIADKRYKLALAKSSVTMDTVSKGNAKITVKLSSSKKTLKLNDVAKAGLEVSSTNERVVSIGDYGTGWNKNAKGTLLTKDIPIYAESPGTAYVTVKTKLDDSESYNIKVCKVTVTAKTAEIEISGDSEGKFKTYTADELKAMNINVKKTDPVNMQAIGYIELKQGEYDRLFTSISPDDTTDLVKMKWTVSGGVTIKNGVVYAKKASAVKGGKITPAKVKVTCGKKKYMIYIVVK
jgi:predicted outer membrane repeat protein